MQKVRAETAGDGFPRIHLHLDGTESAWPLGVVVRVTPETGSPGPTWPSGPLFLVCQRGVDLLPRPICTHSD